MAQVSWFLVVALMVVAGMIGLGVGYVLTPEYSMYERNVMDLGRADRTLDLRYLNAMIAHHRGAMLLAEQASQSERSEVRELGEAILAGEPKLIEELYAWKQAWFRDTRQVIDPVPVKLGKYNQTFDLRFLNALIAHHENGVTMTQDVRLKSSRSEVLDNADAVEAFLTSSGAMLKEWRKNWYNL